MIASLQSLRFIFAIMIFCHHYAVDGKSLFLAGGSCGVSFFIILSGFVMSAGYVEKVFQPNFDSKKFLFKRFVRLYPLHFLCLFGYLFLHFLHFTAWDYIKLLPNMLLVQSWIPIKSIYFSGNAVSWCLSDMLFFYAMFPILAKWFSGNITKQVVCVLFTVLLSYLLIMYFLPEALTHPLLYIFPFFRLVDFIIGMLAYRIFVRLKEERWGNNMLNWPFSVKSGVEVLFIGGLIALIMWVPMLELRYYAAFIWWFIMPEIIILLALFNKSGGVISKLLETKMLVFIGGFSFTFYMIHQMGINVLHSIFSKLGLNMIWELDFSVCFVFILCVSYLVYRYYEVPISKYLRKK